MGIGFSTDQLIDIGLNLGGFIVAGLLTALIYSLFSRGEKSPVIANAIQPGQGKSLLKPTRAQDSQGEFEIIDLRGLTQKNNNMEKNYDSNSQYKTRNREQILRQAREILAQRRENIDLKKLLPVTEGEIAFLKQNLSLQGATRSR
ncbi:MAG: hypothetical protein NTV06_09675 [candidate division Zixibacteria bacterium]|nr:hypothetical protein [candidate division Zixibacteria bacterium]